MHCGNILKNQFGYTPEQVIHQNFKVSLFQILSFIMVIFICKHIAPLKIVKFRAYVLFSMVLTIPFVLDHVIRTPSDLLILQCLCIFFPLCGVPAIPIFVTHFHVYRRFTCNTFAVALSRVFGYVMTSFGIVYLTESGVMADYDSYLPQFSMGSQLF